MAVSFFPVPTSLEELHEQTQARLLALKTVLAVLVESSPPEVGAAVSGALTELTAMADQGTTPEMRAVASAAQEALQTICDERPRPRAI